MKKELDSYIRKPFFGTIIWFDYRFTSVFDDWQISVPGKFMISFQNLDSKRILLKIHIRIRDLGNAVGSSNCYMSIDLGDKYTGIDEGKKGALGWTMEIGIIRPLKQPQRGCPLPSSPVYYTRPLIDNVS